jgi:hypothetical protein
MPGGKAAKKRVLGKHVVNLQSHRISGTERVFRKGVNFKSSGIKFIWACTSHPGVLGSIPKREEPGKTGAPCVEVPGSSMTLKGPMPSQRNQSESFRFKRAAFYQGLKSKVGLEAAKAAALRINLNVQGCSIVAAPIHAPSRTSLLLPLLLSHNLPLPRVH